MEPKDYRKLFFLKPEITYLNHGSFGGCPKEIMDEYFNLQIELEKQPIDYLANNIIQNLELSRSSLSNYIDCDKNDLVFFPNPTTAINMVAKSLKLNAGDQFLTTSHEYGALIKTWKYICNISKVEYIEYNPSLPVSSKKDFIQRFIESITDKTKIIFISHITSATGLIFPIKEICQEARKRNIISIIDGAHVPGHIKLSIKDINPDIYVGACHKWMMSPKGASFLYAKKEIQSDLLPLVISWGWESESDDFMIKSGISSFLAHHQWQGTNDISAYLTIPKVIDFMEKYNWESVSDNCKDINMHSREKLLQLFDTVSLCESSDDWIGQMSSIVIPDCDTDDFYKFLKSKNIEVPVMDWNGYKILRFSIQAYNSDEDIKQLIKFIKEYFKS